MNEQQHQRTEGHKKPYKKPYKKPELVQVDLKPDEAVLGGCKTSGSSPAGPGNSNCHNPANCFTQAS